MLRARIVCVAVFAVCMVAPTQGASGPVPGILDCNSPTLSDDATFSDESECFDVSKTPVGDEIYDPVSDEEYVPEHDGQDSANLLPKTKR